jgi:hypothetical protein
MEVLSTGRIAELAIDLMDLRDETPDRLEAYSIMKERVREVYEDKIWEAVDSEENGLDLDFDDILSDLMDDIENTADDAEYQAEAEALGLE